MEKGLKNLTQAYRSAQRKQNDGTYHDHEDSGIGISDLDEESEDHHVDMPIVSDAHYPTYAGGYPLQQQRVPSIQSMLHPVQHPMQHPMQYPPHSGHHHLSHPQHPQ